MPYERKTIDILISDELREILTVIESESLVAALLLKKRHAIEELVDSPVNFISISQKDKGKISYLSQDRIDSLDADQYWSSSRRYMAKPGAFVSKIFKDVPAKEVEIFSNLLRSQSMKAPFRFDVVKGDFIKDFYYYENYDSNERGSLGVSCMKHEHCQKYFDLYTENKENISMLVMFNDNDRLIGRALLWDFSSNKIMDRIYTKNDEELSFHFKQWATQNGYLYKSEQNWYNTLFFEQIGTGKKELKLEIKLPKIRQHFYPYMDTFKFIDLENDTLYNYLPEDTRNIRVLCSSDGGKHNSEYLVFDQIDRVFRYRNDAAYIDYANVWTGRQNANYSNHNDTWILNSDGYYEDLLGDFIFNEVNNSRNRARTLELLEAKRRQMKDNEEKMVKIRESRKKNPSESLENIPENGETRGQDRLTQRLERMYGDIGRWSNAGRWTIEPPTEESPTPIQIEEVDVEPSEITRNYYEYYDALDWTTSSE